MRTIIEIFLLIVLLFQPLKVYSGAGGAGAAFLKIIPGARPAGMGGAYISKSGDINCLYYNPAGIGDISGPQIGAMHTQWVSDIRYDFAAGVFNMRDGILGIAANLISMGEMEGRDSAGEKTEGFGAYDFAVQFSYAKSMGNGTMGGSLKLIRQQIEDESATGVAIDIGIQRKLTDTLSLGAAVRNLGPKMKFINESYNLPLSLSIGMGLSLGGVTLALDTNYEVVDRNIKISFGTEYLPIQFLSLRGGYFLNAVRSAVAYRDKIFVEPSSGLGGGMGINISDYTLDYAVVPYSDLGTTQRISFIVNF